MLQEKYRLCYDKFKTQNNYPTIILKDIHFDDPIFQRCLPLAFNKPIDNISAHFRRAFVQFKEF